MQTLMLISGRVRLPLLQLPERPPQAYSSLCRLRKVLGTRHESLKVCSKSIEESKGPGLSASYPYECFPKLVKTQ
jgi:hypothetical protein